MMIKFKYKLMEDSIEKDLLILKKSGLDFKSLHLKISFGDFLGIFSDSDISIIDNTSGENSLFFKDSILAFCCNFYKGLIRLKENKDFIAYTFGIESQSYFLKFYIVKEMLIIEKEGKKYNFQFDIFHKEFKVFYRKIISQLPFFYGEIETCEYFQKCICQSIK